MNRLMITLLSSLLLVVAGVTAYATGALDQINGKIIPTTLNALYTFSGGTIQTPATKTAAFTFADTDDTYLVSTAGGAITATLPTPSTLTAGKEWTITLVTAGNAVTLTAGTFSINGSVTDANMDAAGDSYKVMNTGTGYVFTSRYIH